jgi:hypothetical protein
MLLPPPQFCHRKDEVIKADHEAEKIDRGSEKEGLGPQNPAVGRMGLQRKCKEQGAFPEKGQASRDKADDDNGTSEAAWFLI